MMPAWPAATSADEQMKEIVGSGPFQFVKDEWQPGNQVVYVRNADYVPRSEPASGSTGGKRVHLDKVIWRYISDTRRPRRRWRPARSTGGRSRRWTSFEDRAERRAGDVLARPLGTQGWLRPNHLHPPFNNKKARQALVTW